MNEGQTRKNSNKTVPSHMQIFKEADLRLFIEQHLEATIANEKTNYCIIYHCLYHAYMCSVYCCGQMNRATIAASTFIRWLFFSSLLFSPWHLSMHLVFPSSIHVCVYTSTCITYIIKQMSMLLLIIKLLNLKKKTKDFSARRIFINEKKTIQLFWFDFASCTWFGSGIQTNNTCTQCTIYINANRRFTAGYGSPFAVR